MGPSFGRRGRRSRGEAIASATARAGHPAPGSRSRRRCAPSVRQAMKGSPPSSTTRSMARSPAPDADEAFGGDEDAAAPGRSSATPAVVTVRSPASGRRGRGCRGGPAARRARSSRRRAPRRSPSARASAGISPSGALQAGVASRAAAPAPQHAEQDGSATPIMTTSATFAGHAGTPVLREHTVGDGRSTPVDRPAHAPGSSAPR